MPSSAPTNLSLNDFFVVQLSSKMWVVTARPISRVLLHTSFSMERMAKRSHKPSEVSFDRSSDNSPPLMVVSLPCLRSYTTHATMVDLNLPWHHSRPLFSLFSKLSMMYI